MGHRHQMGYPHHREDRGIGRQQGAGIHQPFGNHPLLIIPLPVGPNFGVREPQFSAVEGGPTLGNLGCGHRHPGLLGLMIGKRAVQLRLRGDPLAAQPLNPHQLPRPGGQSAFGLNQARFGHRQFGRSPSHLQAILLIIQPTHHLAPADQITQIDMQFQQPPAHPGSQFKTGRRLQGAGKGPALDNGPPLHRGNLHRHRRPTASATRPGTRHPTAIIIGQIPVNQNQQKKRQTGADQCFQMLSFHGPIINQIGNSCKK